MSKSKRNVVDPEAIIEAYGADTARWFMLSDSPPDRDMEWTDAGVEGAWRYMNRLYRLVTEPAAPLAAGDAPRPAELGPASEAALRATHKAIAAVTDDLEKFAFNRAVARIRELSNTLAELDAAETGAGWVLRQGYESLVQLTGPLVPHLAEELWRALGHDSLLVDQPWPEADPALIVEDTVTVAVQVNGKLRGTLDLARDTEQNTAEEAALGLPAVAKLTEGRSVRKVIVVPNKVINVVV